MNATSRAILQTGVATDASLSAAERSAAQRLIDGRTEGPTVAIGGSDERLLVNQKEAAEMLGVSRVTIWRMPQSILPEPSLP